jgi:mRNA interferase MazF
LESLSAGQVVLAAFPFSDLTSTKLRPCFIIGIAEFDDVVLCQITSNRYGSKRAIPLQETADFARGSIVTNSYIRPDKIATLDRRMITRVLGTVTATKLLEVKTSLKEFLEIA